MKEMKVLLFWKAKRPSIALLVAAVVALCSIAPARAVTNRWMAYNECLPGPKTHTNTTPWSPYGVSAGLLKDSQTGTNLAARLTLTDVGTVGGSKIGAPPASNSPAFVTFNSYVDWTNSFTDTITIQVLGTQSLVHVISGLAPNRRYNFSGTAVRGNPAQTNRWTLLEITGARSFDARHTSNVLTADQLPGRVSANQAAMLTGVNTSGDMVVWQNIAPSSSGTFSVVSRQLTGTVPGGSANLTNGYALESIRLDELDLPEALSLSPPAGPVHELTNITVTFSEPVTNVQAGDLLIQNVPAASVNGSGTTYTFMFPQPLFGSVTVTWATNQAISDLEVPPGSFISEGLAYEYGLSDFNVPVVAAQDPAAGATVSNLTQITVTFDEPVTNVDAADLLINGVPASGMSGSGAEYTFSFAQPDYGAVSVSWATSHNITDLSDPPAPFDSSLPASHWEYTLVDVAPPTVLTLEPAAGSFVSNVTQIAVTFNEPVTNVDAADLLVNGVPATGLTVSNNTCTFTFARPNASQVSVTWSTNSGITDQAGVPNPFDGSALTWLYSTIDAVAPTVADIYPPTGAEVRSLTRIAVTFDEPVSGVTENSLLIQDVPALQVTGAGAGPYTFLFMQPATGQVQVAWAAGQGIRDVASPSNAFAGGAWTNVVEPGLPVEIAAQYVIQVSVDGLGGYYLRDYLSNAAAMFPNFIRMKDQGASTTEARCDYFNSETMPNHSSVLTGMPVQQPSDWSPTAYHGITFDNDPGGTIHNNGNTNLPYKASPFDVAHDRGLSTAFYASKSKFDFFVRSYDDTNGALDEIGVDNGRDKIDHSLITDADASLYGASEALVSALVTALTNAPPNYTFLHFAEPDRAGHDGTWGGAGYSNAVQHVDQQLGRIFAAIDGSPALRYRIAIVLTADHGGIGYGHSDPSNYVNYALPFFVWGPGIPAGTDAYDLFDNRGNPGTNCLDYTFSPQPLRDGDSGNLALALLGLPPIPTSSIVRPSPVPPVVLEIARLTTATALFWPAGASGFDLEFVSALDTLPGGWQSVTTGVSTNGSLKTYTVPESSVGFFRLSKH